MANTYLTVPQQGKAERAARREAQSSKLPALKLMIATPFYMQQCFSHYMESMMDTGRFLDAVGVDWQRQALNGDSYIDRAKNTIVANFLESDCTDLLMIDSDMGWHPEAVGRMLRHPQEIVAGFFPMKNAWGTFAGALAQDENGCVPDLGSAVGLWDGSCLFKGRLLPGGFLRIKRSALERFADHYEDQVYQDPLADPSKPGRVYTAFFECTVHNHLRYGEDATFCRRALDMGLELWVDPNIDFSHYGVKGFTGNFHQSLLCPQAELDALAAEGEVTATAAALRAEEEEAACVS